MSIKKNSSKFDSNNYSFNQDSKLGIYHLANQGYYVKADNLPGHATTIEDCNSTLYHDWLSFTEQKVASMYAECDKVIIIGVSMGAVIALHLGTVFPLEGLIAASPVIEFKNEFHVRVLTRLFHRFKKSIPKNSTFQPDQLKVLNTKFYGYSHYPLSALNQFRKMVDKIKPTLPKIKSPVLLMHSKIDYTAIFKNHNLIKDLLTTKQLSTLVLNESSHNLFDTDSNEKKQIFSTVDNFVKVHFNV